MRIFLFLIAFSTFTTTAFAQINYTELQSEITAVCGVRSHENVESDKKFLDSLNAEKIDVGLEDFLLDKAWIYYWSYLLEKEEKDLNTSRKLFAQCWEEFQNKRALYNLIVINAIQKDCASLDKFAKMYIEKFPDGKDESFHAEIQRMKEQCQ